MVTTYDSWRSLTVSEKNKQVNNFWLTGKVPEALKQEISQAFLASLGKGASRISSVSFGIEGFYSPVILVEVDSLQDGLFLPETFDIFEVRRIDK